MIPSFTRSWFQNTIELWLIHSAENLSYSQENLERLQLFHAFSKDSSNILTTRAKYVLLRTYFVITSISVSYAFLFGGSSYRAIPKDKEKHKYCDQEYLIRQCATTLCQVGNHEDEKLCLPLPNLLTKFQLFLTEVGSDIQAMNFRDTLAMHRANKSHKHNSKMIYWAVFCPSSYWQLHEVNTSISVKALHWSCLLLSDIVWSVFNLFLLSIEMSCRNVSFNHCLVGFATKLFLC